MSAESTASSPTALKNSHKIEKNSLKPTPRVGFAIGSLESGGAEQSSLATIRNWSGPGEAPVLIVGRHSGPLSRQIPEDLTVVELSQRWPRPASLPRAILALRKAIVENGLDILVVNTTGVRFLTLLAKSLRLIRIPVVLFERSTPSMERRSQPFALRTMAKLSLGPLHRYAESHVAVSDGVARDLEQVLGLPEGAIPTVPSGIDVDAIAGAAAERPSDVFSDIFDSLPRPIVLNVGRLSRVKDQATLVRAFAGLPEHLRGSLVILGEGEEFVSLTSLAEELGIGDHVHLPGFAANPHYYMARSDVFVLSSVHEGMPRVLLEALFCGTKVVSTPCAPGVTELVEERSGCRVFPAGDASSGTDAICVVLKEPAPHGYTRLRGEYGVERTVWDLRRLIAGLTGGSGAGESVGEGVDKGGSCG